MKMYIFFYKTDNCRWYHKFIDEQYGHCCASKAMCLPNGTEYLLTFDNLYNYISIDIVFMDLKELIELFPGLTCVIEYNQIVDPMKTGIPCEILTCVTTLKKLLNIANIFIQTPKQLCNYLLQNGGKKIWDHSLGQNRIRQH